MNGHKKYIIFCKKWTIIYLKNNKMIFDFKKMNEYWILFFGKIIVSNDIVKLNKDWDKL